MILSQFNGLGFSHRKMKMENKNDLLERLKALGDVVTRPVALRMPKDVDAIIQSISKETGANYSAVLIEMVKLGIEFSGIKARK